MSVFSRRHRRAISEGKLAIELEPRLRARIWRLMGNHNESFYYQPDPTDNWTERTDYLEQLRDQLLDVSGESTLSVDGTEVSLELWVKTAEPPGVLDTIELFASQLSDQSRPPFLAELNTILGEEDSPWRVLDGQFVALDTVFVHEQIVASSQQTLHAVRFEGAAQEVLDAHNDIADGDGQGAVHNAGKSFESTMKSALEDDHLTARQLVDRLAAEGFLDGLPEELRTGFASQVLMALPWMRNRLGGHGQGRDTHSVGDPYARLAVGLAAVFNEFVVALAIERDASLAITAEPTPPAETEFQPAPFGGADDDIPF
jgi:hypothetical protein